MPAAPRERWSSSARRAIFRPTAPIVSDGASIDNAGYVETGDALKTQFVYVSGPGTGTHETITNFHAAGPDHDTLIMPHADFANLADVIRNTTMSHGNAVIHDPNGGSTMTLMGVSKTELQSHPHDFSFNGTGQMVPGGQT